MVLSIEPCKQASNWTPSDKKYDKMRNAIKLKIKLFILFSKKRKIHPINKFSLKNKYPFYETKGPNITLLKSLYRSTTILFTM